MADKLFLIGVLTAIGGYGLLMEYMAYRHKKKTERHYRDYKENSKKHA